MDEFIRTAAISPLRQRLIDDMNMRRFSRETQRNYVRDVGRFATFLGRSPHTATADDLRRFQIEQREAGVPTPTMNSIVSALRFLFTCTLDRPDLARRLVRVAHPRSLPVVLSRDEVARLLAATTCLKYQAALSVAYGAGLRVAEVASLRVGDIDSERMLIRVEHGKGGRDRNAMLATDLLTLLREWWKLGRQQGVMHRDGWLFPGQHATKLFRRLFLARLVELFDAGRLQFFGAQAGLAERLAFLRRIAAVRKKPWIVYAKPPFAGPAAVLAYLSRYTHRVAISMVEDRFQSAVAPVLKCVRQRRFPLERDEDVGRWSCRFPPRRKGFGCKGVGHITKHGIVEAIAHEQHREIGEQPSYETRRPASGKVGAPEVRARHDQMVVPVRGRLQSTVEVHDTAPARGVIVTRNRKHGPGVQVDPGTECRVGALEIGIEVGGDEPKAWVTAELRQS